MIFDERALLLRTKLLLTQSKLARELGVSLVTIARWGTQNVKPQTIQYGKFITYCQIYNIKF